MFHSKKSKYFSPNSTISMLTTPKSETCFIVFVWFYDLEKCKKITVSIFRTQQHKKTIAKCHFSKIKMQSNMFSQFPFFRAQKQETNNFCIFIFFKKIKNAKTYFSIFYFFLKNKKCKKIFFHFLFFFKK